MRIDILTLFPEMFTGFLDGSLLGAARASGLLDIRVTNIRDFAEGVHRQVDDRPFGGGPGMLLMPGPVVACAEHVVADGLQAAVGADVGAQAEGAAPPVILLTPGGRRLTQEVVEELSRRERIVLVCGRYEGFDARVRTALGAEELSIGDFVLSTFSGARGSPSLLSTCPRNCVPDMPNSPEIHRLSHLRWPHIDVNFTYLLD